MAMIYRKIEFTKVINYPTKGNEVSKDFIDKFRDIFTPPQMFHIMEFEQIGFHDPFPEE